MDWNTWGPGALDPRTRQREVRDFPARVGEVIEESASGFTGAIIRTERSGGVHLAVLEDGRGTRRSFPLGHGFMIDGEPVRLVPPVAVNNTAPRRTASGSVKVEQQRARVARASRIWVEGVHDAELVEKIWGDDLRVEGIVVEPLHGVDDLAGAIRDFSP